MIRVKDTPPTSPKMFEHTHLPNVGLTEGIIPAEIYQHLNKEIVDIHTASETGTLVEKDILNIRILNIMFLIYGL